ncbi:MAG TPA: FAD-binding protein [Planctomycetaceae bacterium]|nr:FAD-binding protein [Planctomycetaceae bacterium]
METPTSIEQVQDAVRRAQVVRVRGGGSKPALSADATLDLSGLRGVVDYDPSELTLVALAGTRVAEIQQLLGEHGQYLPFDPPLAGSGATLGGTVASGLSGPGRFRYGGLRDFVLGVRLVNGQGSLIRGGGKVVKSVAGFELAKLMVGSLGRYGVLVEVAFKVFPGPEATATLRVDCDNLATALDAMISLAAAPLDLMCLELEPPRRLWVRIGGRSESLRQRAERVGRLARRSGKVDEASGPEEAEWWQAYGEFAWVPEAYGLVKIPIGSRQIPRLESCIARWEPQPVRRYGIAGNVVWLAWPPELAPSRLEDALAALGRRALALRGRWPRRMLGPAPKDVFSARLLQVFDPAGRFRRSAGETTD